MIFNYQGAVVDCQWNALEPYSACSVACGEGTQTKKERNLWKSPVAERVLENMRRQFPAMKVNALVQVIHKYL